MSVEESNSQPGSAKFPPDQIALALARITQGPLFRESPLAGRLLEFLVKWRLSGKASELKETTIALEFFGRGSNFDGRYDNSVRMNVSRLRSRLATYYSGDGSADAIIIEIPKGSYVPEFRARHTPAAEIPVELAPLPSPRFSKALRYSLAALAVAAIFSLGTLTAGWYGSHPDSDEKLVNEFFGRFGSKQTALICRNIALLRVDTRFPLMLVYGGKTQASSEEYVPLPQDVPAALKQEAGNRNVRFEDYWSDAGSVSAAFDVSRIFARLHQQLVLYSTRSADPNQLRNDNLIVASTPWFNPVTPYLGPFQHFEVRNDGQGIMTKPAAGQPAEWLRGENDHDSKALLTTLALVALQPGLSRGTQILRITGVDPLGVEGGASFVTSEQGLKELERGLGLKTIPDRFEAVLRVHCVRGQVAGVEFIKGATNSK